MPKKKKKTNAKKTSKRTKRQIEIPGTRKPRAKKAAAKALALVALGGKAVTARAEGTTPRESFRGVSAVRWSSAEEMHGILNAALTAGMTPSRWLRMVALDALEKVNRRGS